MAVRPDIGWFQRWMWCGIQCGRQGRSWTTLGLGRDGASFQTRGYSRRLRSFLPHVITCLWVSPVRTETVSSAFSYLRINTETSTMVGSHVLSLRGDRHGQHLFLAEFQKYYIQASQSFPQGPSRQESLLPTSLWRRIVTPAEWIS
jgi:hypothetical protein